MQPDSLASQAENLLPEEPKGGEQPKGDAPADTGKAPTDGKTDRGDSGDTPAGDGKGEPGGGSEGNKGGDPKAPAGDSTEQPGADEGYVADEGDEPDEPKEPEKTEPSALSPDLQYVVDNLPTLSVRGKDGKNYQVKAAGQLPDDFEFATKRDEMLFTQALAGQELKARELQSEYNQNQQNKAANEFSEKENKDIRRDIGALQREGSLPKFKFAPDDPKFNDDPAVKQAQEVIDYMNKINQGYLEDANKGGVLYHVSFRDAYRLMQQSKPKTETKQQQEDKERKQVTRSTAGAASSAPSSPKAPSFAYVGDLKDMVDMMEL